MGTISGQILFAGQHASRTFLRRYTGYVEQFGEHPCAAVTSPACPLLSRGSTPWGPSSCLHAGRQWSSRHWRVAGTPARQSDACRTRRAAAL